MTFRAEPNYFTLQGKPVYLYSGEVQYFRIPKALWPAHLNKVKAAGVNTVSTYIPWSWHEIRDNKFDFKGETDPQRDLETFIRQVREAGLMLTLKPGPYIVAEYADQGIPEWLTRKHPEILAQGVNVITTLHPTFKRYVRRWYDQVFPRIVDHQITRGGHVAMLQVCNESGLYQWLEGAGDTSPLSLDFFRRYLKRQYRAVAALNRAYQARYRSFAAVPAPSHPTRHTGDYLHWNDWHDFHRWYYAEYLSGLIKEIRKRGIDIQLFHNVPGWVFGRGHEFPVNITFYAQIARRHPEMVFGVDHIPENPNYRNQHDDLVINEMVLALQDHQAPAWAAEQQAGTREHCVATFPNEMELFYKASLGRGLKGMNLYMFSQGTNFQQRGALGPTFYWMTPLNVHGEEEPLYPVVQKIGQWLEDFGSLLVQTQKRSRVGVVFYPPDYHDEFYYPLFGGTNNLHATAAGLRYDPKLLRNEYYFNGLLRMLVMRNTDFEMIDPRVTIPDPQRHQQLWVMALDRMDRVTQNRLADYVKAGGHLVAWPGLPDKDLNMKPCTVLRQRLGIREEAVAHPKSPMPVKIEVKGVEDIGVLSPVRVFTAPDAEGIAHTLDGRTCGILRRVGQGSVVVLGTFFGYKIQEHLEAFDRLLNLCPREENVSVDNPAVLAHVRYGEDYAFLFILNYTPLEQNVTVNVKAVPGWGDVRFPETGRLNLPPLSGIMIPLNLPVPNLPAVRLLWATCEILRMKANAQTLEIWAQPHAQGETQLALRWADLPKTLTVQADGQRLNPARQGGDLRIILPAGDQARRIQITW